MNVSGKGDWRSMLDAAQVKIGLKPPERVYRPLVVPYAVKSQIRELGLNVSDFLRTLRMFGIRVPGLLQDRSLRTAKAWLLEKGYDDLSVKEVIDLVSEAGYAQVPIKTEVPDAFAVWAGAPYVVLMLGLRIFAVRPYGHVDGVLSDPGPWIRSASMQGHLATLEDFPVWVNGFSEEMADEHPDGPVLHYAVHIHVGGGRLLIKRVGMADLPAHKRADLEFMLEHRFDAIQDALAQSKGLGCTLYLRQGRGSKVRVLREWEVEPMVGISEATASELLRQAAAPLG